LVRKGLLPDLYREQIHKSLISKWQRESPDKYTGYELNDNIEELYELMKKISEDQRLLRTIRAFYRINKTLKDIIGSGRDYVNKIKDCKFKIVETIQRGKNTIGINRGIRLFGISPSTYRTWAMESYFRCGHSITKLCNNAYPQQLTVKEIGKMYKLLTDRDIIHWPIVSVAYHGMRESILKAHPNTWYKYARLMQLKRKRYIKIKKKYDEGLRTSAPNEKWHADITEFQTADGKTSYIYLVMDNFSRYITSWRVADRVCAKIRLETFEETIVNAGLEPQSEAETRIELIVDGGTENNNKQVERFIDKYPISKLVALKDILKSNSMVESVNKIIKYNYLYPLKIQNQEDLERTMRKFVIPDYNDKRPHGSLNGLTPAEAYRGTIVNFKKIREKMVQALDKRVAYNRTHSCMGCPFGCRQ
jgi:putative transposase